MLRIKNIITFLCIAVLFVFILTASAKNNTKQESNTHVCMGIGFQGGNLNGGLHTRLWFNERIGFGLEGYSDYDLKGRGGLFEFMIKPTFKFVVQPYFLAGIGYHSQDVELVVEGSSYDLRLDVLTGLAVFGLDIRIGKLKRHSIALEAGYFYGKKDYQVSYSDMGSSEVYKKNHDLELSPLKAMSLRYTFYFPHKPLCDNGVKPDFEGDQCPCQPEDIDGFEDEDGCPDPDNDKDRILDVNDQCPDDPEDYDGFEDKDGCPDPDNDKDGILDVDDKCPNEPEDYDGFEDKDGCPDPDNDKDGILDVDDDCPNKPETVNGYQDEDGCPDVIPIVIPDKGPLILDGVNFEVDLAILTSESYITLNRVVASLNEHEEIHIEIQGHTDSDGSDAYNIGLSERRANAVIIYFIDQGINSDRLVAKGYGERDPIVSNKTKSGKAQNRRVELHRRY